MIKNNVTQYLFPMKQVDLAAALGVSRQRVNYYCTCKNARPRTIQMLNELLRFLENGALYKAELEEDPGRGPLRFEEVWEETTD